MHIEYLEYQVPFCRPFTCSLHISESENSTLWSCLPQYCRTNLIVLLAITAMLAVLTVSCNWAILGINFSSKTRRMRRRNFTMSNYSIYILSLTTADLLVGFIVLPLCLYSFYTEYITNGLTIQYSTSTLENETSSGNTFYKARMTEERNNSVSETIYVRMDSSVIARYLLGTCTHLTLFVSIYTLIAASADRFYAATYSARSAFSQFTKRSGQEESSSWCVNKWKSTRRSSIAVAIVWLLGMFFAAAPMILHRKLHFRSIGHMFSAMTSKESYSATINWYLGTLLFPLCGIWILNAMICLTLWRRKSQLGFQRRRSLKRDNPPELPNLLPNSPNMRSNSDSVFEKSENNSSLQRCQSHKRKLSAGSSKSDAKKSKTRRIYRQRSNDFSDVTRTPRSQCHDSKGSMLRRRVSSIRRAKEMLQRQSSESNITKTLCLVVFAFSVAVVPLIITLSKVTTGLNSTEDRLNYEVTALTVSLLFLFSNSVVNCIIYGARMRDFRSSLTENMRSCADKMKNIFCWCCLERKTKYSSEVVSGVFLVTSDKPRKSDNFPKSPKLFASSTLDRLRKFTRSTSKKSNGLDAPNETVESSNRDSFDTSTPKRKSFYPMSRILKNDAKQARPSSSGYRTDPELASIHEDGRIRHSQPSEFDEIKENQPGTENSTHHVNQASEQEELLSPILPPQQNARLSLTALSPSSMEAPSKTETPSSLDEARKISSGAAEDYTSLFDYKNRRDSRIVTPSDFTLDIDFSRFSAR